MKYVMKFVNAIGGLVTALAVALLAILALTTLSTFARKATTRRPAVVSSIVKVLNFEATGGGTGWAAKTADGDPVIVTNNHVCEVATGDVVRIEDDRGVPYLKHILRRSFDRDLCVVEGIDAPALPLAENGPERFQQVYVYGHPGLRPTAPATGYYTGPGIVPIGFNVPADGKCPGASQLDANIFGEFCILQMELGYSTVPIYPGNSGSPVTNAQGEVIGVANSADNRSNQGMIIPLNYVKEILQ